MLISRRRRMRQGKVVEYELEGVKYQEEERE
jgi:hypothetical protein